MESQNTGSSLKAVGDRFKNEAMGKSKELPPAISQEEYRDACSYLGADILSADQLEKIMRYVDKNWKEIKASYPEGTKLCVAVIPTSEMGKELAQFEVKAHAYLKLLHVSHINGLTYDFAFKEGRYFELLPQYMQDECSFVVHYDEPSNNLPGKDTTTFKDAYKKAYNRLRSFFELPPLN